MPWGRKMVKKSVYFGGFSRLINVNVTIRKFRCIFKELLSNANTAARGRRGVGY